MSAPYDIILVGPITGVPDYKLKFAIVYARIRHEHFTKNGELANVFNPVELPDGRGKEWYARQSLDAIFASPNCTLVCLDGWEVSELAFSARALASCLGRAIRDA